MRRPRAFAPAWPEGEIVQEALAETTCYQSTGLPERVDDEQRASAAECSAAS